MDKITLKFTPDESYIRIVDPASSYHNLGYIYKDGELSVKDLLCEELEKANLYDNYGWADGPGKGGGSGYHSHTVNMTTLYDALLYLKSLCKSRNIDCVFEINLDNITKSLQSIKPGTTFKTPDIKKGRPFTIESTDSDRIIIKSEGGSHVNILINAFDKAYDFLKSNNHNKDNPIRIGASNDGKNSGELDKVTRKANEQDLRIITYIVPILSHLNVVGYSGDRPNKCWLIE